MVLDSCWSSMRFNVGGHFKLYYSYWSNVSNAGEIQMKIISKLYPVLENVYAVFIDSKAVADMIQIEAAITQALMHYRDESAGGMHTRELTSEILYCLSPNRSIKHAMNTFGIQASTNSLIVCVLHSSDAYPTNNTVLQEYLCQISNMIQGTINTADLLRKLTMNIDVVCQEYGIKSVEKNMIIKSEDPKRSLLESILSRMASKDLFRD
uniref:EKC/KEOPS complex subunit CGI121 n=1 Tax=Trichobilharzia regenti TaxID=157069 RepID=A0AA85K6C3_TRIRE|nr:unnamed protein product [Trichobilharzia regenti]